jgi:hypothetical protein
MSIRPSTTPLSSLVVAAVLTTLLAAPAVAQDRPWSMPDNPLILDGFLAWDRGEYPTALERYLEALEGATPAELTEIAQLTGEVYATTEIAPDGGDLRMAPDGLYMSFAVVEGESVVTKVVEVATGEIVATLPAEVTALGPDGQVAYLDADHPAIAAAREADANAEGREARVEARRNLAIALARDSELRILDLTTGAERVEAVPGLKFDLAWVVDQLHVVGADEDGRGWVWDTANDEDIFDVGPVSYPTSMRVRGTRVFVDVVDEPMIPVDGAPAGERSGTIAGTWRSGRVTLERFFEADEYSVSDDGGTIAWVTGNDDGLPTLSIAGGLPALMTANEVTLSSSDALEYTPSGRFADPVVSPNGAWVTFAEMDIHDWEVWALPTDGSSEEPIRITDHIHHDRRPMWVGDRILAVRGEGRHQRSYLYHVEEIGEPTKLFHNNTIRTIAPEYDWIATPDGSAVFIVAERDGDTVSPERAVHKVDLTRPVTPDELEARIRGMLAAETSLRERGEESFRVKADEIRPATEEIQTERIYMHAADLYRFGSKNIRADGDGNRRAIEYLVETLEGWGYEPILEWWQIPPDIETTNVVVRIEGTVNPELVYVVSSHFDSSTRGPGADDNSSGTTALLEVARVLADRPQEATIELAFFTGEESGLLGSRRYVARAQETGKRIVGALNNDMVGWAGDHRLDNTIRYSNPGIRDIQHAAAIMFSDLITYDALYYKSTDAAAYYEAYGDIVGGIGSYPVLSNPHYHQYTDRLETINHELVGEVARTTAATIMLLASTPSRLNDLAASTVGDEVELTWSAAPEYDVVAYEIEWTDASGAERTRRVEASGAGVSGATVSARIPAPPTGATVGVRAVDADGQRGWDAARVVVGG